MRYYLNPGAKACEGAKPRKPRPKNLSGCEAEKQGQKKKMALFFFCQRCATRLRGLGHVFFSPYARRRLRATRSSFFSSSSDVDVGIFVDAENMSYFLSQKGAERLIETASEFGRPIVRKAFGDWSNGGVNAHQDSLVSNGFQLIHTPHPVRGKGTADHALTVEVMATVGRMPDLMYYVLATGDSDFSHLFWHLRQSGRRVVGVGPESPLSHIVKNSADKFVYTETNSEAILSGDFDTNDDLKADRKARAFQLVKRAADTLSRTSDATSFCPSVIKAMMVTLDSAFDHRHLGLGSFTNFLQASGHVGHVKCSAAGATVALLRTTNHHNTTRKGPPLGGESNLPQVCNDKKFRLLRRALSFFDDINDGDNAAKLKGALQVLDDTFDHKRLGYSSFTDFLDASNVVKVHLDDKGGTNIFRLQQRDNAKRTMRLNDDDDDLVMGKRNTTIDDATRQLVRSTLDALILRAAQRANASTEATLEEQPHGHEGEKITQDANHEEGTRRSFTLVSFRNAFRIANPNFDYQAHSFAGAYDLLRASDLVTMTPGSRRFYVPQGSFAALPSIISSDDILQEEEPLEREREALEKGRNDAAAAGPKAAARQLEIEARRSEARAAQLAQQETPLEPQAHSSANCPAGASKTTRRSWDANLDPELVRLCNNNTNPTVSEIKAIATSLGFDGSHTRMVKTRIARLVREGILTTGGCATSSLAATSLGPSPPTTA